MWYTPPNCTQHLLVITKMKTVVIIDPKCVLSFGALWPRDSPPYCWTVSLRQVILLPKFLLSPWSSLTLSALPGRVASCCCVWKVSCWKGLLLSEDLAWTPPNKAAYSLLPVWSCPFLDQFWNPLSYHTLSKYSRLPTSILYKVCYTINILSLSFFKNISSILNLFKDSQKRGQTSYHWKKRRNIKVC